MQHCNRWRGIRPLFLVAAVLVGSVIGAGVDHLAFAQQPGIKRTELLRADAPTGAAHEAVVAIAELPPGAVAGRHRHHGIEVGYVLEGTLIVQRDGRPDSTLTAGQAFKNDPGIHNAKNPGRTPTRILAVYIVEKGKPLAEPAP